MGIAIGLYYFYMFYVINVAFQIDSEIKCIILYYVESLNNSFIMSLMKELYMKIYIFQGNTPSVWKTILLLKYALKQMFMVRAVTSYVHQHQKR